MLNRPLANLARRHNPLRPSFRLPTLQPRSAQMSSTAELNELIASQGALVRQLKTDKSPDAAEAVQKLLELKAQLSALGGGKKDDKKAVKFTLKTPKASPFRPAQRALLSP